MTFDQLVTCTGCSPNISGLVVHEIRLAMEAYNISTTKQKAAFLANIGHESGGLRYRREIWGPTPSQQRYEGRIDLGNTHTGDGIKFRGHGYIQTTGRANHARVRDRLRAKFPNIDVPDFEQNPEALCDVEWAALSAADFWDDNGLNDVAENGTFDAVCDIINKGHSTTKVGDSNGYADRLRLYEQGLLCLT